MADSSGKINPEKQDRVEFVEKGTSTKESSIFIGAPDFRVFIWGAEISHDVFSVQISQRMDEGLSTATISLVNDSEKWTFPTSATLTSFANDPMTDMRDNLFGPGREGTNTQSDSGLITPKRFARIKRDNAIKQLTRGEKGELGESGQALLNSFKNSDHYPFVPGGPLLQMNDPIRVFLKNPWNLTSKVFEEGDQLPPEEVRVVGPEGNLEGVIRPQGDDSRTYQAGIDDPIDRREEWYFAFTGYIATVSEDFDGETDRSIIRLFCEDIRRVLRYMRTSTNVTLFNINLAPSDMYKEGDPREVFAKLSNDTILVKGTSSIAAHMKMVSLDPNVPNGFMDFMLFGDVQNALKDFGLQRKTDGMPVITGVLGFKPENKRILLIEGSSGGDLEPQMTEFLNEMYPILSSEDVDRFGADWSLGSDEPTISDLKVDANRFFVIMPSRALFAQGEVTKEASFRYPLDYGFRVTYIAEFRSRLEIMNEFIKKLDCIWHTTPKGDIVLEFPQYDFIPQAFDSPWRNIFSIQNGFEKFTRTEDDRNIKTLTVAIGSPIPGVDQSNNIPFAAYAKKINFELAARFGIREQLDNRPFMYSEEYVNSSLPALASMWQELANSDAYRIEGLTTLPNFRAVIARPYFFKYKNVVAFATEIHHTVVWNSTAQTTYGLKYVRHYDKTINNWRKISGEYGWFWGRPDRQNINTIANTPASKGVEIQSVSQKKILPDPTADELKNMLDEIYTRESLTGKAILTEAESTRLESIIQVIEDPNTSYDVRNVLLNEFDTIIGEASGRQF